MENIIKEKLDSLAFSQNVLKILSIDVNIDFAEFEKDYVNKFSPKYVYARIPIEELENIHHLENNGFNFVETQFKMTKRLAKLEDMKLFNDEYELVDVEDEKELGQIYKLSDEILKVDRIFLDEKIPNTIAQKRYHLFIEKSFNSTNENLYKTIYKPTGKAIGFHTNMAVDDKNILFFIGGILPEFHSTGACFAHEYLIFNHLFKKGYKNITTHISASNYNIINFEMRTVGFKPKQTYVVLRKVY